MIIEDENELNAWNYVKRLAFEATDRICDDLDTAEIKIFEGLVTPCEDNGKEIQIPIRRQGQIVEWLSIRTKLNKITEIKKIYDYCL